MKETIKFSRGIGMMTTSGITFVKACEIYSRSCRDKRFKKIVEEITAHIKAGGEISSELKKYSKRFPPIFLGMIKVGEATGEIGTSFIRGSILLEKEYIDKRNFRRALLYPKILFTATILMLFIMLFWMVPIFLELTEDIEKLPIFTKLLLEFSKNLKRYWLIEITLLSFLSLAMKFYVQKRYLLKIPILGSIEKIRFNIRFGRLIAILLKGEVMLIDAIALLLESEKNREIYLKMLKLKRGLERGRGFTELVVQSKLFSELDISLIRAGEESGELAKILDKIAEIKEEELQDKIRVMLIIAEPTIVIVMGIILGTVIAGVYLPILDMIEKNI